MRVNDGASTSTAAAPMQIDNEIAATSTPEEEIKNGSGARIGF
jgi:hypothetical protein